MKYIFILLLLTGCASTPKYDAYTSAQCFCKENKGIRLFFDRGVVCNDGSNANTAALQNINLCGANK